MECKIETINTNVKEGNIMEVVIVNQLKIEMDDRKIQWIAIKKKVDDNFIPRVGDKIEIGTWAEELSQELSGIVETVSISYDGESVCGIRVVLEDITLNEEDAKRIDLNASLQSWEVEKFNN